MKDLFIIKIGDNIIDNEDQLEHFLSDFSKIKGFKIIVHGGGKISTHFTKQINSEQTNTNGHNILDLELIKRITMSSAGWVNKSIVAKLQAKYCDAIGLSGVDGQCVLAQKSDNFIIDNNFTGDISPNGIKAEFFRGLSIQNLTPVVASIASNIHGQLLNINADILAAELAASLSKFYYTKLIYCFDEKEELVDKDNKQSVLSGLDTSLYQIMKSHDCISDGMIPKLDNAFNAKKKGVDSVIITHASEIINMLNHQHYVGTAIYN